MTNPSTIEKLRQQAIEEVTHERDEEIKELLKVKMREVKAAEQVYRNLQSDLAYLISQLEDGADPSNLIEEDDE